VIQISMVSMWFKGSPNLALAMGFTLSMSRLGDFLTLTLSAVIAKAFGSYIYSLWAAAILCLISFISVVVYGIFDRGAERYFPDRKVNPADNELNFKAVLHFDIRFFIVSLLTTVYYAGIFPFVGNSTSFLETKYGFSKVQAPIYLSIITFSSMILSPVMGKVADINWKKTLLSLFWKSFGSPSSFFDGNYKYLARCIYCYDWTFIFTCSRMFVAKCSIVG